MNHLEQLVAEWLQYNGYFVRTSVLVGRREKGGFEGELDVVGYNFDTKHLIHVECSLDALRWDDRETRFAKKFECGRKFKAEVFKGFALPDDVDQAVVLQFAGGERDRLGGGRLISGKQFIREVLDGLKGVTPASGAVPTTLPLIRTLQLAAAAEGTPSSPEHRLIRVK